MADCSYKRYATVGPGRRKCSCCYPPPGKVRRIAERLFNRRERREARKLFQLELLEIDVERNQHG